MKEPVEVDALKARVRTLEEKLQNIRLSRRVLMNILVSRERDRMLLEREKMRLERSNRKYARALLERNTTILHLEEELRQQRELLEALSTTKSK